MADEMLQIDGVTVRYGDSDTIAVKNLSLSVAAGERVALIGPSGAGKSTILRLAAGLTLPTEGSVETFGIDSHELGRRAHRAQRSQIGIISQDFSLTGPLRVAGNVASGRLGRWSWIRSLGMLARPGPIDEITAALDQVGIANKIWERTDQLSGGQQQRTAIARTLFQAPDLLLADEPVSSLDPARSDSVMAGLSESQDSTRNRTVITSMHDAPLARRYCDRIIAMRMGCVQFDLPSSQVTDDLLDELYELDEHRTT